MPRLAASLFLLFAAFSVSPASADDWITLFDGTDISKWEVIGNTPENWKIEDGILYCAKGAGWLATKEEFGDFELEVEFKVYPDANSGVFLRAPKKGDPAWDGLEVQILDNDSPKLGELKPYQLCGGLYGCDGPTANLSKIGEWQKFKIVAKGRNIQVIWNDKPSINTDLDNVKNPETKHLGLKRTSGHVGLQAHGGRVDFRKVRIKPLSKSS
jgi:hypothetical protein